MSTAECAWLFEKDEICRTEYTKALDCCKRLDIETYLVNIEEETKKV